MRRSSATLFAVAGLVLAVVIGSPAQSATSLKVAAATKTPPVLPVARGDLSTQSVYFVMTDRFANGDTSNDQAGLVGAPISQSGFDPTSPAYYHGGDFKGLTAHLPYIKSLGFTSLWVTPPVKGQYVQGSSADYHGYWGLDFTTIDPHLGTEADFKNFVTTAHQLGMKVILDIVVNHTADVINYQGGNYNYVPESQLPYKTCDGTAFDPNTYAELSTFPKLCAGSSFPNVPVVQPGMENIKSPSFLNDVTNYHNRGNINFDDVSTYLDGDFDGLDDLFTEKPEVLQGEIALWSSWITRFDVDGFRIDTAQYVNPAFWQDFIPAILKVAHANGHATFPIFGEITSTDPSYTSGFVTDEDFPSVLDFPLQSMVQNFVTDSGSGTQLADFFNSDDYYTSANSSAYGLATFVSNHDMGRIGTAIYTSGEGESDQYLLQRDELSDALLFLLRGGPVFYYGDEKGMTGSGGDQAARQDMFATQVANWQTEYRIGGAPIGTQSAFDIHNPLEDVVTGLNKLTSMYPALRSGTQQVRYADSSVLALSRYANSQEFLVAFNGGDKSDTFTTPVSTSSKSWSVIGGMASGVTATPTSITMTLPERSWVVLKADSKYIPSLNSKKLSVTINPPSVDIDTQGWVEVSASVPGNDFETVTFSAKQGNKSWVSLGSTDHRTFAAVGLTGGLYRTYIRPSEFKSGTSLQLVATVKDATGKIAVSKVIPYTVSYTD